MNADARASVVQMLLGDSLDTLHLNDITEDEAVAMLAILLPAVERKRRNVYPAPALVQQLDDSVVPFDRWSAR